MAKRMDKAGTAASTSSKWEAKVRAILASYPAETEVYVTADGFGFFDRKEAEAHAAGLLKKEVITIKREE